MAKGWIKIETVNDIPKNNKNSKTADKQAQDLIRNTKSLTYEKLLKETIDNYNEKKNKEEFLMSGYDDKRLKSKTLIKEAHRIKTLKEKENKNNANNSEKA